MNGLNIVFAGTPEFGVPVLDALMQSRHKLTAIYTQPDRPAGRGQTVTPSAVKVWASAHQIPVYQPVNFKTPDAIAALKALNADVMIVIAYGLILPKAVLVLPRLGCINVHASLLPRWRGASPIQQAIVHGDTHTGVTIMQMDEGLDTGAMLAHVTCAITPLDTSKSLHDTLSQLACEPLLQTLDALQRDEAHPCAQQHDEATYAGKINKEDAIINWNNPAVNIERMIRAYTPWPIAHTHTPHSLVRILRAQVLVEMAKNPPGTIVHLNKQGMYVATADKLLLVTHIQFPGSKVIAISDYLNASKKELYVGLVLCPFATSIS
jgi:methionyl-tRNA formyltransferase